MRRMGPLLMSTVLVTGCAGLATNNDSLRTILERSGQSQPRLSAYDQGKRHLQFGQAGLAIQAFEEALKANPNSVSVLNGLAIAYDRLGRGDVSQRYLDRALTLDPNSAVTLNNLAYLNLVQGNTAVAHAYAERAKIAADLPMDMMLPETIANAVDRNAAIASQIAASEKQERAVAEAPALPPESDIKRVGLNEWELRIRPPNPADAVRINLPLPNVTPRVIEPMAPLVVAPMAMEPLTEAVVVSDIPDSVMADLTPPAPQSLPAPAEAVVASLPQSEPVPAPLEAPVATVAVADPGPPGPEPVDTIVASVGVIPEPVIASLIEPPVLQSEPVPTAPVLVELPEPESVPAPEAVAAAPEIGFQPSPRPVREEPAAAAAPAVVELRRTFVAPKPDALAPVVPVLPVLPPQPLPEPAREDAMVIAALPAPERVPLPVRPAPVADTIALAWPAPPVLPAQPLPAPVAAPAAEPFALPARPAPVAEAIAAAPRARPALPPQLLPEPVAVEPVLAMLSPPEPAAPAMPLPLVPPVVDIPAPAPALPIAPAAEAAAAAPETGRLKDVLASLSAPASVPVAPITRAPEAPKPVEPVAPAATAGPAPRPAASMVASLAPSRADASQSTESAGLKSEWRAAVPASTDIRVSNGTGRRLMAGRFAGYFRGHGLFVRKVANANSFDYRRTVIFYNPDQRANAEALAAVLPFPVRLAEAKQGRGQIELILGFDLLSLDDALRSA